MPQDDAARKYVPPACPICGKSRAAEWRPFCSKRCADVDLGRWFGGCYAVPGEPAPDASPPDEGGD